MDTAGLRTFEHCDCGTLRAAATVTVNGRSATREGECYFKSQGAANASSPAFGG
jgi:hypothetical protein